MLHRQMCRLLLCLDWRQYLSHQDQCMSELIVVKDVPWGNRSSRTTPERSECTVISEEFPRLLLVIRDDTESELLYRRGQVTSNKVGQLQVGDRDKPIVDYELGKLRYQAVLGECPWSTCMERWINQSPDNDGRHSVWGPSHVPSQSPKSRRGAEARAGVGYISEHTKYIGDNRRMYGSIQNGTWNMRVEAQIVHVKWITKLTVFDIEVELDNGAGDELGEVIVRFDSRIVPIKSTEGVDGANRRPLKINFV
ncbi:hypothetical protein BKA62DRAFT_676462 [Auriculariales sp. MPI-PUGE-AT-0066]|nr:hypothetical protein BKA62DRAFT_676462 [Auriculariales sp. MPI-PUGE-AT-0066]